MEDPAPTVAARIQAQKVALRDRLLTDRRRLSLLEVGEAAQLLADDPGSALKAGYPTG